MADHVALFVTMYPASMPKQATILTHLRQGARGYYRQPTSHCTAWSYLVPLAPKESNEEDHLIIAGLEMYSSKSALQDQVNDKTFFQPFEQLVVDKQLCAKQGTMLAWYFASGFVTRSQEQQVDGRRVVVRVRQMTCIGSSELDAVVRGLGDFAEWSRGSDFGVLTFAVFTRKKAERELLVYLRYRDETSMRRIEERPECQSIWILTAPLLVAERSHQSVWREVDDSFVWPMLQDREHKPKL